MTSALAQQPTWPDAVEETLQWGVSRRRSRNGAAERVELVAPWPVRIVRLSAWSDIATDRASLDLGEDEHLIPWLPGCSAIVVEVADDQYTLYGDPAARGFRVGDSALIETPLGETEVVTVGAVASDLFLSAPPTLTIVAGTTIMPLLTAVLDEDQITVVRASPNGASYDTSWRVVDTQHVGADAAPAEDWTDDLEGYDVLTRLALTSEAHQVSSERFGGLGGAWRRVVVGAGRTLITQRHSILSAAEALDLRRWLYRRRGPLMPCWVPLGQSMGSCIVETYEANAVLEIDDPGADDLHELRQAVIVWPTVGEPSVHTVGDILRFGESDVPEGRAWLVGLDPALSHTSILGAQWLVHCRLTETVSLSWRSPEAVEVTLQWLSTPIVEVEE